MVILHFLMLLGSASVAATAHRLFAYALLMHFGMELPKTRKEHKVRVYAVKLWARYVIKAATAVTGVQYLCYLVDPIASFFIAAALWVVIFGYAIWLIPTRAQRYGNGLREVRLMGIPEVYGACRLAG